MLHMTLDFINSIKQKYDLKYIQLRDTSTFTCKINKKDSKTNMCDLYMLTRGQTWLAACSLSLSEYGKYGFIPFNPDRNNKSIDIDGLVKYKLNQQLVDTIKIKYTNLKKYLLTASKKLNITDSFSEKSIDKIIEIYNDKSIKEFFSYFMKKYDSTCHIFNEIYLDFMKDVGMQNLHSQVYFLPLVDISHKIYFD